MIVKSGGRTIKKIFKTRFITKLISFDVYQRASEKPVFRILKNLKPINLNEKFLIKDSNGKTIEKSENLNRLIKKASWNNLKIVK